MYDRASTIQMAQWAKSRVQILVFRGFILDRWSYDLCYASLALRLFYGTRG